MSKLDDLKKLFESLGVGFAESKAGDEIHISQSAARTAGVDGHYNLMMRWRFDSHGSFLGSGVWDRSRLNNSQSLKAFLLNGFRFTNYYTGKDSLKQFQNVSRRGNYAKKAVEELTETEVEQVFADQWHLEPFRFVQRTEYRDGQTGFDFTAAGSPNEVFIDLLKAVVKRHKKTSR